MVQEWLQSELKSREPCCQSKGDVTAMAAAITLLEEVISVPLLINL